VAALSDELASRIPSLTVTLKNVPDGATAEVSIDGVSVPAEAIDQARKLNPGHHVVTAKAGSAQGKQETDLAEQDAKTITIELTGDAQQATEEEPAKEPATAATESSDRPPLAKGLLYGGFGAAGVGIVVGSITGILSLSKTSSIKGSPACAGSVCNPSEDGDISSARTTATISTVSFVVAGVGAAAGVVGLLMHGGSSPPADEQPASAWIAPTFGLGTVGVHGQF
jgi:hypothetical protein